MSETIPRGTTEPGGDRFGVRGGQGSSVRPRVSVVLAAGRSERLAGVTGGGSKALVRVGGPTLIERAVRTLLAAGLERVVVVVGYQAGPVAAVANRVAPGRVRTVFAERWELGNGASLAAAAPHVADEDLFVLLTADHVFGEGALAPLLVAGRPGVLVDHAPAADAWAEGMRVRLHEEHVVAFSKELGEPSIDCGAFLLPPAVFDAQRRAQARGDTSLAAALTELANDVALEAIALRDGCWWQDVDTREDLRRAVARLRRSLTKPSDGPVARYLNRPVSTRLSMALAHLPIHPDVVSLVAFLLGITGALLLARAHGIAAAALVQLASILDGVDGEIARLQVRASPGGALLDGVLDRLADAAILAGVAVWAADGESDPTAVIVLAVAAATGALLSMATKDRITALGIPPAPERWIGFLMGGRDARLLIVAVAALLGRPFAALVAVSLTSGVSLVVRLLLTRTARS
jgi:CDP-L-myo-inositol myo-inositolphosphotransferase